MMTDREEFFQALQQSGASMRVGRKLGRTLYLHFPQDSDPNQDLVIGIVDTAPLAEEICRRWNGCA